MHQKSQSSEFGENLGVLFRFFPNLSFRILIIQTGVCDIIMSENLYWQPFFKIDERMNI